MLKPIWIALITVAALTVATLVISEIALNVGNDKKTSDKKEEVSYK